ncbi:uncharacterized protein DS421_13g397410 [Arachis hypogaea]|nr:uncharacterized protein DS421_13g397410 [Arachis hypogaea]
MQETIFPLQICSHNKVSHIYIYISIHTLFTWVLSACTWNLNMQIRENPPFLPSRINPIFCHFDSNS